MLLLFFLLLLSLDRARGKEGSRSRADAMAGVAHVIRLSYIKVLHNIIISSFILYCAVRQIVASGCASTNRFSRLISIPLACASDDKIIGGS